MPGLKASSCLYLRGRFLSREGCENTNSVLFFYGLHSNIQQPWPRFNMKTLFLCILFSIFNTRRSNGRRIFIMGIPMLARRHLYIETVPWTPFWYKCLKKSEHDDSLHTVKTVLRLSFLYDENFFIRKTACLYWSGPRNTLQCKDSETILLRVISNDNIKNNYNTVNCIARQRACAIVIEISKIGWPYVGKTTDCIHCQ